MKAEDRKRPLTPALPRLAGRGRKAAARPYEVHGPNASPIRMGEGIGEGTGLRSEASTRQAASAFSFLGSCTCVGRSRNCENTDSSHKKALHDLWECSICPRSRTRRRRAPVLKIDRALIESDTLTSSVSLPEINFDDCDARGVRKQGQNNGKRCSN